MYVDESTVECFISWQLELDYLNYDFGMRMASIGTLLSLGLIDFERYQSLCKELREKWEALPRERKLPG